MTDEPLVGNDPLVAGMVLSVRYRRDFYVSDATSLMVAARRAYCALNGGDDVEAAEEVTCAADVLDVLMQVAGLIGGAADARFATWQSDGIKPLGYRVQYVIGEPSPLPLAERCLEGDRDPFALPWA